MSKVEKLISKPLNSQQFGELTQVVKDVFFFSQFIYVVHPVRGKVKFDLYPFQKAVLWQFLTNRFNIILKFRQAGITELISMYCLWLASYHPNKVIQIISIKDRVAKKVLRKIKYMYRNLPDHLKVPVINGRGSEIGTGTDMEFANGSIISSIPTTENAGRSEGLSLLVIDEAAIIRWANQIWAAAFPTLSTGGSAILNSTPYGVGNWFHKQWVEAVSGGNDFNAIRLKWRMHPERDDEWYKLMSKALGPRRTAQEIDGDFLTSGNSVFNLLDIRAIEEELEGYEPAELLMNGQFRIFKYPDKDKDFFIGSDVSTGRSQDYTAFTIMDRYGEEYACFKGKVHVNRLADLLGKYGKKYNYARVAPESNDIGLAVTSKLEADGYKNLHYTTRFVKEKGERKPKEEIIPGWYTTRKNRPVMVDQLEEDIREDRLIIRDPFFVAEAYTFIYDNANRPVAMGKGNKNANLEEESLSDGSYSDDAIMGKAITNIIRRSKRKGPVTLPG
jgi:hypothetical protein